MKYIVPNKKEIIKYRILKTLKNLSENNKIYFRDYIEHLILDINEYKETTNFEPFTCYLLALYDGLKFKKDNPIFTKELFKEIYQITSELNEIGYLSYITVDQYINKLEQIGLDTTPYY